MTRTLQVLLPLMLHVSPRSYSKMIILGMNILGVDTRYLCNNYCNNKSPMSILIPVLTLWLCEECGGFLERKSFFFLIMDSTFSPCAIMHFKSYNTTHL